MHIKITKMPTCQHVNIRVSKNSYEVKYFRLTDFESCRRGWSPAEADDKGGLSGLQETLYKAREILLRPFDYVAKIHKKNSERKY